MNETDQAAVTPPPVTPPPATGTVARVHDSSSAHWYTLTGEPMHEVMKADKKGKTKTTLTHARKLNLLPSVSGIIKLLDKPALNTWKTEQACLALLTTPRQPGEPDDAFVNRVLHVEEQQEQEGKIARDFGNKIHDAVMSYFEGQGIPEDMGQWVNPAINALLAFGERASSEVVLVGDDYAGCTDLIQDCESCWRLWDYKSTKKLPDPARGAWLEHRLQLAAYAKAFENKLKRAGKLDKPIIVGNLYISSKEPGQYVICEHEDWEGTYRSGFAPLVIHWQWQNGYRPENPDRLQTDSLEPSVEVQNLRAHYIEASKRCDALEAEWITKNKALEEQLRMLGQPAEPTTPAGDTRELDYLRQEIDKLRIQNQALDTEVRTRRAQMSVLEKKVGVKAPVTTAAQPVPTPTPPPPAPPADRPAMPPGAPALPHPKNAAGKKVVWSSGVPTAQPGPEPGPLPLQ